MRRTRKRWQSGFSLVAPALGPVVACFGLAACGGGGRAGVRGGDASTTDAGAPGDSTVPMDSGVATDDASNADLDSGVATDDASNADLDSGVATDDASNVDLDSGVATDASSVDLDSGVATDGASSVDSDSGLVTDGAGSVDSGPACDGDSGCSGSMLCCSGNCVDVAHDPRNCGSCGNACSASQFCTGTLCDDAVFTNLCANQSVTVVNDPYLLDEEAGASLGQSIAASCPDAGVAVSLVPQTQPGVLVQGDAGWRPNTGAGTTLVAGGGTYGQLSVAYMDDAALTPVYLTNDGTTSHIYQRATGLALVKADDTTLDASHDFFILELAVEPQSGTLCFFGEGIYAPGTVAAGYYGSQVLVPNYMHLPAPWYVYEWTDTNGDTMPDNGDAFNLVAQGP